MTRTSQAKKSETTVDPVQIPPANVTQSHAPEFLRLPPPGQLCAWTGLSRSALNELILGTPRNNFKPVVKSFCLRKKGAQTGIRIVDYACLAAFIRSNPETGTGTNGGPRTEAAFK